MSRFLKSLWFIGLLALGTRLASANVANRLSQVQLNGKNQIHMVFSEPVNINKIQKEYRNGLFQLSLSDTIVHPAKVLNLTGGDISKVFAYQYSPNLIRCRLSIEGTPEEIKNRVSIQSSGKMITITVADLIAKAPPASPTKDEVKVQSAQALRMAANPSSEKIALKQDESKTAAKTQDLLLDKIKKSENQPLKNLADKKDKSTPSPVRSLIALSFIVAVIAGGAWFLRRSKTGANLLSQIRKKHQMIEVIANQHLGPKRSISVVKIGGRTLVLGVTPESVNLITEIAENQSLDLNQWTGSAITGKKAPSKGIETHFQGILDKELGPVTKAILPNSSTNAGLDATASRSSLIAPQGSRSSAFRDRVRSRIEEMKRL